MTPAVSPLLDNDIVFRERFVERPKMALNVWRINLLIVDDDGGDLMLILRALKGHPDLGVVETRTDPIAALGELAQNRLNPTLILLDLRMPAMSGFAFLSELRRIPAMADVPVVFLTTSAFQRDAQQASLSTACGYIVKPDSLNQLKMRLDNLLNQVLVRHRR